MLNYDNIVNINVTVNQYNTSSGKYATGLFIGDTAVIPAEERLRLFTTYEAILEAGYSSSAPEAQAAALYFSQSPAPRRLYLASIHDTETALDALKACMARASDFYGVYVCNAADAELADMAKAMDNSKDSVLFYDCADEFTNAAPGIFEAMQISKRAMGFWNEQEYAACALMGLCMGYMASSENEDFAIAYKALEEVNPSDLTQAQANYIKDAGGNVYVQRGSHKLIEQGALSGGLRYNERMQLDRLSRDLGDACVNLLVTNPKLPQTDATTSRFINACSEVLKQYTDRGFLASGTWNGEPFMTLTKGDQVPDGYLIMAEDYASQSAEDRALRKAVPLYVALTLAGNVESVVLNLNVQL